MLMRLRASSIRCWQHRLSLVLRIWFNVTVLGAGLLVSGLPWDSVAQAGSVSYVYDDLGRLLAVVDGTAGQAAIYQYDAVGNLLGITNQSASILSILNFMPKSGPVGTTVTISGTGFSATANQNTVKFNGTTATVTSATITQLVVTVPTGATTGPISVTVSSTSATTGAPFTVTTSGVLGAPTITSFTPTIGIPGTAVTISGTNFDPTLANDKVTFNSHFTTTTSATSTSIGTTVPTATGSGKIAVATPLGQAISSGDFFIPPPSHPTTDVVATGRIVAGGSSQTVTINTANKMGLLLFDGTAGQKVSAWLKNSTFSGGCNSLRLSIYTPDNTELSGSDACGSNDAFIDAVSLPTTGTYTVAVLGYTTGQATVTLYNVINVTGSITAGGAGVAVTLGTPGQRALLTFSGSVNQKVSAWLNPTTLSGCGTGRATLALLKPDGTSLTAIDTCTTGTTFLEPVTLPVAGTYTLVLNPLSFYTGSATVTLYTVSDVTGSITPGGAGVSATLGTPGQRALLTFSGSVNQKVSAWLNPTTLSGCGTGRATLTLLKPDGSTFAAIDTCANGTTFLEPVTLPVAGTYTLVLDPLSSYTGSATVTLYTVVDVTGSITPGGPSVPVTLSTPGQNARLTFNGTAGQKVSAWLTNSTFTGGCSTLRLSIFKPDNTELSGYDTCGGNDAFLDAVILPTTGTYTIVGNPYWTLTGQFSITLYTDVDVTGSITPGGPSVPVTLSTPGQNARFTFNGAAGQVVSAQLTNSTFTGGCSTIRFSLFKPDNTELSGVNLCGNNNGALTGVTLSAAGTYAVVVNPFWSLMGNVTLSLTSP